MSEGNLLRIVYTFNVPSSCVAWVKLPRVYRMNFLVWWRPRMHDNQSSINRDEQEISSRNTIALIPADLLGSRFSVLKIVCGSFVSCDWQGPLRPVTRDSRQLVRFGTISGQSNDRVKKDEFYRAVILNEKQRTRSTSLRCLTVCIAIALEKWCRQSTDRF